MPDTNERCGLLLAAPSSGSGKTVLTLAILRALKRQGVDVCSAKAGPDYIDPAFHQVASGSASFNLDPWAMSPQRIQSLIAAMPSRLLLVEAMMGLFDGAADGSASAADLAAQLDLPIILVVDCAKQSHSIAALVEGFKNHRKDVKIIGVILNKVGSSRHEALLRSALVNSGVAVFGAIPRMAEMELPERHLGLVQAGELSDLDNFIDTAADRIMDHCDLDAIMKVFAGMHVNAQGSSITPMLPLGQRIAIARDEAFSFIYPHLLEDWKAGGCELSFFSPLKNEAPNATADVVYLPGGYPELHCETLSAAEKFKAGMFDARARDAKIYGECGGYMVLGDTIIDKGGTSHKMLGLLKLETSFAKRKLHLGYRNLKALTSDFGYSDYKAHEFHYTVALKEEGESLFSATDALGEKLGNVGLQNGNVFGSYMHLIDRSVL